MTPLQAQQRYREHKNSQKTFLYMITRIIFYQVLDDILRLFDVFALGRQQRKSTYKVSFRIHDIPKHPASSMEYLGNAIVNVIMAGCWVAI
jgi:hypothetical protein